MNAKNSNDWPELALKQLTNVSKSELRLYPELARIEDDDTRYTVHARAKAQRLGWFEWVCAIVMFALIPFMVRGDLFPFWLPAVGTLLVILLSRLWYRDRVRRQIRAAMCRAGIPICVHCGYDTRGLTENRCPECGKTFESVQSCLGDEPSPHDER